MPQRQPLGPQLSARASHAAQLPPAVPHWVTEPVTHSEPAQQPVAHEVESQTHWLLKHRCPAEQAGPVPQRHEPVPQLLATVVSHVVHAAPWVPQADVESVCTQLLP